MKRITIDIGTIRYRQQEEEEDWGGEWFPLPQNMEADFENLRVIGRFQSTCGGGAIWKTGKLWKEHLSNAPYEPRIDARVTEGRVTTSPTRTPADFSNSEIGEQELVVSYLAGYFGRDITLRISAKEIISDRPKRKALFEIIDENMISEQFKQGSLTMSYLTTDGMKQIDEKIKDLGDLLKQHSPEVLFFNHCIVFHYSTPYLGFDNKRLIKVEENPDAEGLYPVYVVSSDHIDEPIKLPYQGWWLLEHPIPEGDVD